MACSIIITSVTGSGTPLDGITVAGTYEDCPPDFDSGDSNIEVRLSCRAADDPDAAIAFADTYPGGNWRAHFAGPLTDCACGGSVFVSARCLANDDCAAIPFEGAIPCDDCPKQPFSDDDDVDRPTITAVCDPDGTVLVTVVFDFFNDAAVPIRARINPGPGGMVVTEDSVPTAPGTSTEVKVVLRYDTTQTPDPGPWVEYLRQPGNVLMDCPPLFVLLPVLPDCRNAPCPVTSVLEVRGSDGTVYPVSGPNAVACLMPDTYSITVLSPSQAFVDNYFWYNQNGILPPAEQPNGPTLQRQVTDGSMEEILVSVDPIGECPPLPDSVILEGCVINCDAPIVITLVNDSGEQFSLDADCVPAGQYTVTVVGLEEPPWDFRWFVDGVQDTTQTSSALPVSVGADADVDIRVEVLAPGCRTRDRQLSLTGCDPGGGTDGGGSLKCAALLWSAISLLVAGVILAVVGQCTDNAKAFGLGIGALVAGIVAFGFWAWWCTKSTACDTLHKARCTLIALGWTAFVIGLILGITEGLACGIGSILAFGGWQAMAGYLKDVATAKGCEDKTCYPDWAT